MSRYHTSAPIIQCKHHLCSEHIRNRTSRWCVKHGCKTSLYEDTSQYQDCDDRVMDNHQIIRGPANTKSCVEHTCHANAGCPYPGEGTLPIQGKDIRVCFVCAQKLLRRCHTNPEQLKTACNKLEIQLISPKSKRDAMNKKIAPLSTMYGAEDDAFIFLKRSKVLKYYSTHVGCGGCEIPDLYLDTALDIFSNPRAAVPRWIYFFPSQPSHETIERFQTPEPAADDLNPGPSAPTLYHTEPSSGYYTEGSAPLPTDAPTQHIEPDAGYYTEGSAPLPTDAPTQHIEPDAGYHTQGSAPLPTDAPTQHIEPDAGYHTQGSAPLPTPSGSQYPYGETATPQQLSLKKLPGWP